MKCFYIILFIILAVILRQTSSAKMKKNNSKLSKETSDLSAEKPQPAIIAIEIVDPNENSTSGRNSKRTIEKALGYGYNNYDSTKKRYEVYKYSQHDIPPYKGSLSTILKPSKQRASPVNVQQSIQYTLPTITQHIPDVQNVLSPGTTLYSSLNSQGYVGDLTSSISKLSGIEQQNGSPVPVIVLRIYPDQLKDSTIQANLPEDHPFAKSVNSVNIQSLLLHYIKALRNPSQETIYKGQSSKQKYQTPHYYTQPSYNHDGYQKNAPDSGNIYQYYQQEYPEGNQLNRDNYQHYDTEGVQVQGAPAKYQIGYENTIPQKQGSNKPAVQEVHEPQQQYYYVTPNNYPQYLDQNYQLPQENLVAQQYYPAEQQPYHQNYKSTNEQQYSAFRTGPNVNQQLLTKENYPSDKHTRVVFRTKTGTIRTAHQLDPTPQNEVKTIKIHVPNNIAKVEVHESKETYQREPQTQHQKVVENPYAQSEPAVDQQNRYVSSQQEYYIPKDAVSFEDDRGYNYQNVEYDDTNRYFKQRDDAMSNYFFQNYEGEEKENKMLPRDDVAAAYEDAAFPSTTRTPEKRRVKGKKRT